MPDNEDIHAGARQRSKPPSVPRKLDLAQFASVEDAISRIEPGDRYVDIGKKLDLISVAPGASGSTLTFFWLSMLSRGEGLHQAIAREARHANPVAVFPLIRAFLEAVVLVMYVTDHPEYVKVLGRRPSELPEHGPKRKSMQALLAAVSKRAPGAKAVYGELSEITHFGATAMWTAHVAIGERATEDGEPLTVMWTNSPRWKNDEQAMIACAQTLELANEMVAALTCFARRHVLPLWRPTDAGTATRGS